MKARLVARASEGLFVLHGPAVREIVLETHLLDVLHPWVGEGQLFAADPGIDVHDCSVDVFVDESVPPDLSRSKRDRVSGALMRVPDGRLEFRGSGRLSDGTASIAEQVELAPGNYWLDAWIPDEEHAKRKIPMSTWRKLELTGCAITVLLPFAILGAMVRKSWSLAIAGGGGIILYWLIYRSWYTLTGKREAEAAWQDKRLREDVPPVVGVLRKMPEGTKLDGLKGGALT